MHDELLADRPTENPDLAAENYAGTTASRGYMARDVSSARSAARTISAAYTRVRELPLRTMFLIMLGAYVALTAAVVFGSPLDIIDRAAAASDLAHRFPHAAPWLLNYVKLGQRGPSSHVAFVYLVYRALRQRSWKPLILFVTALTMLNVTVGTVKLATGRLGPALTTHPRAVFDGGDIFPSGHTSNAVVIFGVLAMVAVDYRRYWIALAVFVSTTVGLSTIFLDTHWVTDVLGGWIAGALVLLALPAAYGLIERWSLRMIAAIKEWFRPARATRGPATWEAPTWDAATWEAATWEALPRQHDLTSEMLTEDARYR